MTNYDLLQYAIDSGMIDMSKMQDEIVMKKREEIISKHPYQIWQGKDGRWRTYFLDKTSKEGRKLVAKSSKEKIEDLIVGKAESVIEDVITLNELYLEWIKSKTLHTDSTSTINRITVDWNKYYANDEIALQDIRKLNKIYLDDWIHAKIKDHDMTRKKYYNMSIILRQSLIFAVDKGYIEINPFANVKINLKMLQRKKKKEDGSQVFLEDEQPKVEEIAFKAFERNPKFTSSLSVPLCFQLGCRVGELAALKTSDIQGNYVHIQRMEVRDFAYDEKTGESKYLGKKIVEHTKSLAGDRWIYLTSEARRIIDLIIETNNEYKQWCDDYIFVCRQKRISSYVLSDRLAEFCLEAGIEKKRMHKIRKTYISTLLDNGVNISKVRETVGHSKESITLQSYCYNRKSTEQTENQFESVLVKKDTNIVPFRNTRLA